MENSRFAVLITRVMDRTITDAEHSELLGYLADLQNKGQAEQLIADAWEQFKPKHTAFSEQESRLLLRRILDQRPTVDLPKAVSKRRFTALYPTLLAAASIILIAIIIPYFTGGDKATAGLTLEQAVSQYGIEPGTDKAVIKLGDGRTIVLDGTGAGVLAEEGGMHIKELADGEIRYEPTVAASEAPVTYNTITIPKGGHYRLVLPDGTKVHLNSQTTLKYPTQFAGRERMVELEGEAFFEVQHLSTPKPFIVKTLTQEVEVLGTSFNIDAYGIRETKTTLVEGSLRVVANGATVLLHPGEQVINREASPLQVEAANMDQELAWHHGYFLFNDEGIESIMERVARWYDVEVEYHGNMADKRFGGTFQRSKSITQLLTSFRTTGLVDFKITERRIIVMEK
ncbi:FecR family protein [Parapedobacter sp. 2B3]